MVRRITFYNDDRFATIGNVLAETRETQEYGSKEVQATTCSKVSREIGHS